MTALIQAKDLGYTLGTKHLFQNLNLSINQGDRVGLVGHNGAGKTSLLNLLAGLAQPDEGELVQRRGLTVGMVEQFVPEHLRSQKLIDAVLDVLPEEDRFPYRAETVLGSLGFDPSQMTSTINRLSGGQQNIALLARAQILEPDVLLMDEPGNHMDVTALAALRRFLNETTKLTYVMISHDRDLLDDCCTHTLFLRDLTTYAFNTPYSKAKLALEVQDTQAAHRLEVEEKEIDRIRKSAKRLAQWGKVYDNEDLARKAKTMEARAEKLEAQKTFVTKGSGLELSLATTAMRSKSVLTLENLEVSAPDDGRKLLSCEFLVAKPGDRIALLGTNGVGKSTTINRILSADEDDTVRLNPNVEIGYVDQELNAFAERQGRYDWLAQRVDATEAEIKKTLLHSGVAYPDFGQNVTTLSGGEKARMMFMALYLKKPNLMILDEPTNHIDLESREELELQLCDSGATLLITSHDRRFLEAVCDRFWLINNKKLLEIDSLDTYYDQVIGWQSTPAADKAQPTAADPEGESQILARIEELEGLLEADQKRKTKFQKPQKQVEWQNELDELWARLQQLE